jgi:hypothetical protein
MRRYIWRSAPQRALDDVTHVVRDDPRPDRQFHRALACFQLGQTEAAAQALRAARRLGLKHKDLNPLERPGYPALAAKLL